MTPFTPAERAVDAAWILAAALIGVLVGLDWLKARLRNRHKALTESTRHE